MPLPNSTLAIKMARMIRSTAAVLILLLAVCARGESWTALTADFQQHEGQLVAVSDQSVSLQADAQQRSFVWRELILLEQNVREWPNREDGFVLYTGDGQRLLGRPRSIANDQLLWRSELLGEMRLAMETISGLTRPHVAALPQAGDEDRVVLANGDELRGIVDAGEGGIALLQGAKTSEIRWDDIDSIALANVAQLAEAPQTMRIELADGSICSADALRMEQGTLHLVRGGEDITVSMSSIRLILNPAGRARFLADISPQRWQYVPYLQPLDDKAGGIIRYEQIKLDHRVFRKVICLRPRTQVSWQVPMDGKLHLLLACHEPGERTDMSIRIWRDRALAYEQEHFRGGLAEQPLNLPVAKGQTVTLEADYAEHFDIQDELLLLQAAFVADR